MQPFYCKGTSSSAFNCVLATLCVTIPGLFHFAFIPMLIEHDIIVGIEYELDPLYENRKPQLKSI